MAEMLDMVAFHVIGNDQAVALAGMHGQLDLNVFAPVMADKLPTSLTILANGVATFTERCVVGIVANESRLADVLARNTALATALAPLVGYARAAEVAKRAVAEGLTVREAAVAEGILSAEMLDAVLDPAPMTEPGVPAPPRS
jgi:fumarate hydratase class II